MRGAEATAEQSNFSVDEPQPLPESSEDIKRFRSWEINVKDLVGDAVGNMSMSPTSRDIALAARRGLFIFDLESLDSIPRFLPQGGTWDVADVQWNPHPSHAEYIVSTSSEKLIIWNLRLGGKTSLQHILRAHYRAITDINWHTTECDIVCSIGIDAWIWAWDIRTPEKPIFGLSPFKAGGTQVKWNYKDGNLLASSHGDEVLIWDRRKGSLPVAQVRAHTSKIYGIDWSRSRRDEIVTCSLDKTIKIWDSSLPSAEPKGIICTNYPVWRARNLPFGEGILSLPQRGETTLEMFAKNETQSLVETFEGHTDVVKEFVWRRGPHDDFQLITWSKDRTLRFWPIDPSVMEQVGYKPELRRGRPKLPRYDMDTFSHPPEVGPREYSAISAPFLQRTIIAEVRAPLPPKPIPQILYPHQEFVQHTTIGQGDDVISPFTPNSSFNLAAATEVSRSKMSKAGTALSSMAKVDQLTWLASVKEVSGKRGSSSGGGSHDGGGSRFSSRSSGLERDRSQSALGARQRSGSLGRLAEERTKETESSQSLHDEITTVLTGLSAFKIKLEKHDLLKKRTCTLGLLSKLGGTRSVFMRVTLTFPRDYPQATYPNGTPTIELERNPLISSQRRDYILQHVRRVLKYKRPCFEACLRFLLFTDDRVTDSDESSDEDMSTTGRVYPPALMGNKNLAEPRTSQGTIGPNGELVCFFQAVPRLTTTFTLNMTYPPSQQMLAQDVSQKKSYFQSPALVADAVRRLSLAATDRIIDSQHQEIGMSIARAMTNLLTLNPPHSSSSRNFGTNAKTNTIVTLLSTRHVAGSDKTVAEKYIYAADTLAEVCERNAAIANAHGRFDHERMFRTLQTLFRKPQKRDDKWSSEEFFSNSVARDVILRFYSEIAKEKDVQMLAIISMLVLQTNHGHAAPKNLVKVEPSSTSVASPPSNDDYFSLGKPPYLVAPISFAMPRLPSPKVPFPNSSSMSSSNSSRGSWSSLFNTGPVRQFMTGMQDTLKEGLLTPLDVPAFSSTTPEVQVNSPVFSPDKNVRTTDSSLSQVGKKRARNNSNVTASSVLSASWSMASLNNPPPPHPHPRKMPLRFVGPRIPEMQVVFEPAPFEESTEPLFAAHHIEQFRLNIYHFAEQLFRWQLYYKRLELLKAVADHDISPTRRTEVHRFGIHRLCTQIGCQKLIPEKANACPHCFAPIFKPLCTICRLPAKGLAFTCVFCSHVTHITCWNALEVTVPICPAGCGCFCSSTEGQYTRPSTRLGFTPPTSTLLLSSG